MAIGPGHKGVVSSSNGLVTDSLPRCHVCVSFGTNKMGGSAVLVGRLSRVYRKLRGVFPSGDTSRFGARLGGKHGRKDHGCLVCPGHVSCVRCGRTGHLPIFGLGGCGNKFRRLTCGREGGPFNSLTTHALNSLCTSATRKTGGNVRLTFSSVLGKRSKVARQRGIVGGCLGVISVPPMSNYSLLSAVSMNVRSVYRGTLASGLGRLGTDMNITMLVRITANRMGTVIGVAGTKSNGCCRVEGGTVDSVLRPKSAFGATSVVITLRSNGVAPRSNVSAKGNAGVVRNQPVGS